MSEKKSASDAKISDTVKFGKKYMVYIFIFSKKQLDKFSHHLEMSCK